MGKILATGSKKGDLYSLDSPNPAPSSLFAKSSKKASVEIWHARLGHPQLKILRFSHNNSLLNVNDWLKKPSVCSSCQQRKSCKSPFSLSQKIESIPLQKIHCDLRSPSPVISVQKLSYVAFVDNCTRHTWFYPLR